MLSHQWKPTAICITNSGLHLSLTRDCRLYLQTDVVHLFGCRVIHSQMTFDHNVEFIAQTFFTL